MSAIDKISRLLNFDKQDERFELLEREEGAPKSWGGWNDIYAQGEEAAQPINASLEKNEETLRSAFRSDINKDIIFRRFNIGSNHSAMLVYMNGMASDTVISEFILRPLMTVEFENEINLDSLINNVLQVSEAATESDLTVIKLAVMDGRTVVFVEGMDNAILLETRGFEKRSVTNAENEKVVRGPKEGFSENIRTNITLIRRIIHSDDLVVEFRLAGGDNSTHVAILYRDGVTNRTLIETVKRRLASIDTRMLVSTGSIEQLIEDCSWSPVPQSLSTERPDRVASYKIGRAHV